MIRKACRGQHEFHEIVDIMAFVCGFVVKSVGFAEEVLAARSPGLGYLRHRVSC